MNHAKNQTGISVKIGVELSNDAYCPNSPITLNLPERPNSPHHISDIVSGEKDSELCEAMWIAYVDQIV